MTAVCRKSGLRQFLRSGIRRVLVWIIRHGAANTSHRRRGVRGPFDEVESGISGLEQVLSPVGATSLERVNRNARQW